MKQNPLFFSNIVAFRRRIEVTDVNDNIFEHIASAEQSLAREESAYNEYLHIFVIMLRNDADLVLRDKLLRRCIPSIILVSDEVNEDII
jgi:hypothetical protein